jgi:hypothetical protein
VPDKFSRDMYEVADNLTKPFTGNLFLPAWVFVAVKRPLPHKAERIIGYHCRRKYYFVHSHFRGRQPLNAHVAFQFAVKLLHRAVIMVEFYDCFRAGFQICPPGFHFNLRYEQLLPFLVYPAFGYFKDY